MRVAAYMERNVFFNSGSRRPIFQRLVDHLTHRHLENGVFFKITPEIRRMLPAFRRIASLGKI